MYRKVLEHWRDKNDRWIKNLREFEQMLMAIFLETEFCGSIQNKGVESRGGHSIVKQITM